MKVAIYVRVSQEKQTQKFSPTAQREGGKAFAARMGWTAAIYEEAKSGSSMVSRPEFARLWDDVARGSIRAVWVKEQTRISRSVEDSAAIRKHFLLFKCKLYIDDAEVDLSDLTSSFMYSVQAAVGEYERGRIAERMKRGTEVAWDQGRRVYPRLFGYSFIWEGGKRKWIADPDRAEVVRSVYKQWVAGAGLNAIQKQLNADLRRFGMRGAVTNVEIKRWLTHREYIGETLNTKGNVIKSLVYPAIVDRSVWEKAQERMVAHKRDHNERQIRVSQNAWASLLTCPECGALTAPATYSSMPQGVLK